VAEAGQFVASKGLLMRVGITRVQRVPIQPGGKADAAAGDVMRSRHRAVRACGASTGAEATGMNPSRTGSSYVRRRPDIELPAAVEGL